MTQDQKARALARLAEIEEEARKIRIFLEMLDQFSSEDDRHDDLAADAASLGRSLVSYYSSTQEIVDCARKVLTGRTVPMHINKLYDLVVHEGVRISGQNPKGNLSAKLAPVPDIQYIRDRGWILVQEGASSGTQTDEAPDSDQLNGASGTGNGRDRESPPLSINNP